MAASRERGLKIWPVVVGPLDYLGSELNLFQAFNDPSRPLAKLQKVAREEIFARLTSEIREFASLHISAVGEFLAPDNEIALQPADDFDYSQLRAQRRFERCEVFLPSLLRGNFPPFLSDLEFIECRLLGPIVMTLLSDYELVGNTFHGSSWNELFLPVQRDNQVFGVVGVQRCKLHRCNLFGVGICGTPEQLTLLKHKLVG